MAKDPSIWEKKDLTHLSYNDSYWPHSLVCYSVPFATRRCGSDFWAAERAHGVSRAKHLRHHGNSALGDTLGLPAQTTELPRQPLSSSHHFVQGMYTNLRYNSLIKATTAAENVPPWPFSPLGFANFCSLFL